MKTLAIRSTTKGYYFKKEIETNKMLGKTFYVHGACGGHYYVQNVKNITELFNDNVLLIESNHIEKIENPEHLASIGEIPKEFLQHMNVNAYFIHNGKKAYV